MAHSVLTYWVVIQLDLLFDTIFTVRVNTLRPRQNGRHFASDIFKCIFLNEDVWISIKISLKFVSRGPINNIAALVRIMAWRRPGDKPLSEPMMIILLTHICVTRPQWVNCIYKMKRANLYGIPSIYIYDKLTHINIKQSSLNLCLNIYLCLLTAEQHSLITMSSKKCSY